MRKLPNIHPGEILLEEFLKPFNITAYRLAKETHLSPTRISEIIRGKRGITADTALRFSRYIGNSADFWLGIQAEFDLREQQSRHHREIASIRPLVRDAALA
ncbi:MAG TPA: HigA family addiction module antitoxin [Thermodesulfobacteriota bacterium]|nr:HigA family addiction module antitoxin [Thermodesulfobacteriota bacterium]